MNACQSNQCAQGRKTCPCPEACEMPVQFAGDEPADIEEAAAKALIRFGLAAICAVVALSFVAGYLS